MQRRAYIDWLRGFATVVMIEAHTIDAWTVSDPAVRALPQFKQLQFLAGWAAPLFLWLAGVSVAFAAASHMRKGRSAAEASWLVQKRGWQIFGAAFLFRLQSFMLSPTSTWGGLLRVDILNAMGLAMVASAWCWGRGRSERAHALWLLAPAALCVLLAQYAPGWDWPNLLGDRLQGYVRLVGGGANFALFPWAGFVLAGTWLGRALVAGRDEAADRRFHIRLGVGGALLMVVAFGAGYVPAVTPYSTYWFSSTSWFLMRLGVMTLMLALSWAWLQRPNAHRWSPMVLFGRTSLFVYWVHVEVVYGFPTYPLRHALSIPGAIVAYLIFTTVVAWFALKWNQRTKGPLIPAFLKAGGVR